MCIVHIKVLNAYYNSTGVERWISYYVVLPSSNSFSPYFFIWANKRCKTSTQQFLLSHIIIIYLTYQTYNYILQLIYI